MKSWKSFNDECTRCGNNPVDVFTDAKEDFVYDGDNVECFECGLCGSVLVDEDDDNTEDFELMQVYLMAKAMKYSQWKEWLNKHNVTIK